MKPRIWGEAHEIRFADDAILCFVRVCLALVSFETRERAYFKDFDWWWNRSLPTQFPAARSKTHLRMTAPVSVVGARIKEHEMGKSFAQNYFRTTSVNTLERLGVNKCCLSTLRLRPCKVSYV